MGKSGKQEMNLAAVLACVVAVFSLCHIPRFTILAPVATVATVTVVAVVTVLSFCHIAKLTVVTLKPDS